MTKKELKNKTDSIKKINRYKNLIDLLLKQKNIKTVNKTIADFNDKEWRFDLCAEWGL